MLMLFFLFPLLFFLLLPLLQVCRLVPFTLLSLITPAVALSCCPLYSSLSYNSCCCSVFLSPLLFFILLALLLLCLLVPLYPLSLCIPCCSALFPFTLLQIITPAAALSACSPILFSKLLPLLLHCLLVPLYSSLSYYPYGGSVLFPFTFLSLCIPCCLALFPFTLYLVTPAAALFS